MSNTERTRFFRVTNDNFDGEVSVYPGGARRISPYPPGPILSGILLTFRGRNLNTAPLLPFQDHATVVHSAAQERRKNHDEDWHIERHRKQIAKATSLMLALEASTITTPSAPSSPLLVHAQTLDDIATASKSSPVVIDALKCMAQTLREAEAIVAESDIQQTTRKDTESQ